MKINKLSTFVVACFALGTLGVVTACDHKPAVIEATSIALNKNETTILLGSSETLTVTFTPENTSNKDVVWSSSDATIVSVSDAGVVTANKVGSATITVASASNSQLTASCEVRVTDNVVLSGVNAKHEFVVYNSNKAKSETGDDGFYDHEQSYKVGDDNAFNVKPELTVLDAVTFEPVSASDWDYDFAISATLDGQAAGSQYFSVTDARSCDVQFTSEAVGKTFTISVTPGGIDEARKANLTKSITVDVIDGYNVYNAKELGYFDTRGENDTIDNHIMEGDVTWQCKWTEFKAANGMRNNYTPAALILQKDIKVTVNDIPSNFVYTAAEAQALGDGKAAGSLRDWMYVYERTTAGNAIIDGNYFALDFSEIPLIKRERFKTTNPGEVVGHAAMFKLINGGDILVRNVNMTGNAKNAATNEDKVYGGGVMFVKGSGVETFKAYNVIATKFFITFMGEKPYIEGNPFTKFDLEKVKCFNNYNSFMYNWGSTITAKESLFRNCGGPVIIQDHTGTDDYESADGLTIYGYAPTTNFVDCEIKNYVAGGEAWFQQFGADGLTSGIKMLSDLFYGTGLNKSFVVNKNGQGKLYAALAAQQEQSYFNFVALNKSGSAEGITTVPACGAVNIVNSDKTLSLNYKQPVYDDIYQTYLKYSATTDPSEQMALALEIAAKLTAKGYSIEQDLSDLQTEFQAYMQTVCFKHGVMRSVNANGAPIFDFGDEFPFLMFDGKTEEHPFLQDMMQYVTGVVERYPVSAEQLAKLPDYCSLYYGGMALVMGLADYVA